MPIPLLPRTSMLSSPPKTSEFLKPNSDGISLSGSFRIASTFLLRTQNFKFRSKPIRVISNTSTAPRYATSWITGFPWRASKISSRERSGPPWTRTAVRASGKKTSPTLPVSLKCLHRSAAAFRVNCWPNWCDVFLDGVANLNSSQSRQVQSENHFRYRRRDLYGNLYFLVSEVCTKSHLLVSERRRFAFADRQCLTATCNQPKQLLRILHIFVVYLTIGDCRFQI